MLGSWTLKRNRHLFKVNWSINSRDWSCVKHMKNYDTCRHEQYNLKYNYICDALNMQIPLYFSNENERGGMLCHIE